LRELATRTAIRRFLHRLAEEATRQTHVYLTGGASAVLLEWRDSTIDVDLKLVPDSDELLRAIARLKNDLNINIELAAPDQFIPEVPGWQHRSRFIERHGRVSFFHYDLYSQALSKVERGHAKDRADVEAMAKRGLIHSDELLRLFEEIEPRLYLYPAIDAASFRAAVEELVTNWPGGKPGGVL
jgi:hypothetical protein